MEIKYLDESCVYNDGVECKDHDPERCKRCGWAPDVAERRKEMLTAGAYHMSEGENTPSPANDTKGEEK